MRAARIRKLNSKGHRGPVRSHTNRAYRREPRDDGALGAPGLLAWVMTGEATSSLWIASAAFVAGGSDARLQRTCALQRVSRELRKAACVQSPATPFAIASATLAAGRLLWPLALSAHSTGIVAAASQPRCAAQ